MDDSTDNDFVSTEGKSVVILGAGFCRCVTNGNALLMKGFFDQLDPRRSPHLWKYLDHRG